MQVFIQILVLIMLAVLPANALTVTYIDEDLDLKNFEQMIVVDQGRVKPIQSYARNILLRFSGRTKFDGKEAVYWFSRLLFSPETTENDKIFLINNPEIVEALGIEPDTHRRYSFAQLKLGLASLHKIVDQVMQKPDAERTSLEKEFIRVFNNFHSYIQLSEALIMNRKHPDFDVWDEGSQRELLLRDSSNNLFNIIERTPYIEAIISGKTGSDSVTQRDALRLAVNLYKWVQQHRNYEESFGIQEKFAIIPYVDKAHLEWFSTWDLLLNPNISNKEDLFYINAMYSAYRAFDQEAFDKAVLAYQAKVQKYLKDHKQASPKIKLELFYNKLNAFTNAKFLYGLAFLLAMLATLSWTVILNKASLFFTVIAFLIHSLGIISRVLILGKPPVTNLFETFIFVAWIVVLLGLLMRYIEKKSNLGLVLASFSGLVLLLISGKFAADGDTMQVLIAVLNSNFWLSTHVICITIGYAGVFAAGVVGHIYLISSLRGGDGSPRHAFGAPRDDAMTAVIMGILAFGLCFSFLGTMLGGIWADQSWGRFWGWDPKENGALLIVLWSAIVFHARMAGLIHETGIAICSVIACMVVMTSWFGINLLGVGLHSYGFTQGLATGLYIYYALEIVFIIFSLVILKKKKKQ